MSDNIEQLDVEQSDSSPEIQEQQPAAEQTQESADPAATQQQSEEQQPFHTHPRFRELVESRNQLKSQLADQSKAFEQQINELRQQLQSVQPKQEPVKDALLERLKGIDPEFAERISKLNKVDDFEKKFADFEAWQQAERAKSIRTEAENTANKFYEENKVPAELREIYENHWRLEAQNNKKLGLKDLPEVLKTAHEKYGKLFETMKRETTKTFVESKRTDASKPSSQPKGTAVKQGGKPSYSPNPNEAKSQVISNILAEVRAAKDV